MGEKGTAWLKEDFLWMSVKKGRGKAAGGADNGFGDGGNIPCEDVVEALKKLPDHLKVNYVKDAGIQMAPVASCGMSNCSEFDKGGDISPRLAPPTQEDGANTPCG